MIKLCAFSDEAGSSIQEQITALKRNGVSYTELRSIDGKNVSNFSLDEAKEYQNIFESNGITVWSIGSPLGKEDIDCDFEEYSKKIEHVCKLANIFKTDKIRMFSFFKAYEKPEKVFTYLREMVKIGQKYGVYMYHENEKDIYGDTLDRVLDIMNNVDGLKYIYDPANYLQCNQSADKTLDALHSKTDYFHIKDVIVESGAIVPAGFGDGKIDELVQRVDRDVVMTLEPHLTVFAGYKDIDNTEMKHKFTYASSTEAFDTAVSSLKEILKKQGYKEVNGAFVK
ncbi:MAG: sugar phosphate isomerase/epimerase [Clostridia bacterium]|nr:sugar phosphate isomerase/epimerase [Clostridia bacterium]